DAVTKKIRYRFIGVGNGKYTIEIVKQPILKRVQEKLIRCRQLQEVFLDLQGQLGIRLGCAVAHDGDAREGGTWDVKSARSLIVTSPPYLPASSGREHYSASRALAFAVLGLIPGERGYFDS